jgi:COX assembly mitochondrial protein 1
MANELPLVPKRVEEALFFRLKRRAFDKCDAAAKAYVDCCRGRSVSQAWACRGEARGLSSCLSL